MAVTKILPIRRRHNEPLEYIMDYQKTHGQRSEQLLAIDYISNDEKTADGELVSGYNCKPRSSVVEFAMTQDLVKHIRGDFSRVGGSDVRAYHIIQSFPPDDQVTPEEAHEIGRQLMHEFLDGKHEYVIATHIDKEHIHNHVVFNATSFYTLRKFRSRPYQTAAQIRSISDRLCAEHGLQVLAADQYMKSNYQMYQKYRHQTTYLFQIRKRMNFLLETATDLEALIQDAKELDVSIDLTGQHATYLYGAQIRNSRDNKLSDDGRFTRRGLVERLEQNKQAISYIETEIEAAFQQSETFEGFKMQLEEDSGLTWKRNRQGQIQIVIHGEENIFLPERAIDPGYAINKITEHYKKKTPLIREAKTETVKEAYEANIRTNASEVDSPVLVDSSVIREKTATGLLIEAEDGAGRKGAVFIDANHVEEGSDDQHYQIHLGDQYNYYFMEDGKQTNFFIKGERLLRQLEIKMGVPTFKLEVSMGNIQTLSEKGINLSFEQFGIQRLFLPSEAVHVDKLTRKVYVELSENWNYYYQKTASEEKMRSKRKNPYEGIKGKKLMQIIEGARPMLDAHLKYKLDLHDRKLSLQETKQLEQQLSLLRRNRVKDIPDLLKRIDDLHTQKEITHEKISALEKKIAEYNTVAKYLLAYHNHYDKWLEAQKSSPDQKAFKRKYSQELQIFNQARDELDKRKLSPVIGSEKVVSLVKENQQQEKSLKNQLLVLDDKLSKYQSVKNLLTELNASNDPAKKKGRVQVQDDQIYQL